MAQVKLTERTLKALKAKGREYFVWDSEVRGLGVRVKPSGVASYLVQYRNENRRQRRLTLGKVGTLRLEQARRLARLILEEVAGGGDPSADRHRAASEPTVADLAERYMVEYAAVNKKPRSREEDERNLRLHVLPRLGSLPVSAVKRSHVESIRLAMKDKPVGFNRVRALLSKMFNLAETWEMRGQGTNPCMLVEKYPEKGRERILSKLEFARVGDTLRWAEGLGPQSAAGVNAIRLYLFTGCRKNEILTLEWQNSEGALGYVDMAERKLVLNDSKTGPRRVMLNSAAFEVLESIEPKGSRWVIPGKKLDSHLVGMQKIWARIRERANLGDVHLHDMRHEFGSAGGALQMGLPMIGRLLGNRSPSATNRYVQAADDPLRETSEAIGGRLKKALGGGRRLRVVG